MAEIPDVLPGEPIEADWGNPIRDRTAQRYLDAAERDTLNPVPVSGDLAYLVTPADLQFYNGAEWVTLLTEALGLLAFLLLDSSNGPLTDTLSILGDLLLERDQPRIRMDAGDGLTGYQLLAVVQSGGDDDGLFIGRHARRTEDP